ncbi:MAG TPA: helix-turn-helix transcriptional regulator, partial [Demequina sp.]|nr:helix-turn-helix transcriptional regulator [Demequina sp.]
METQLMAARRARGWSQLRVVVELESRGVRRRLAMPSRTSLKTQLSRWENGHVRPGQPYVGLLAAIYELTPVQLGLVAHADVHVPSQRSAGGTTPLTLTPESLECMDQIRYQYARIDNTIGPTYLLQLAAQHVALLEPTLVAARGRMREEALRLCSRFSELAGWLCQDAGDLSAAEKWTDLALDFAEERGDPQQRAYVLMRKSGIMLERHEHARSVSLAAAAAHDIESLTPRLGSLVLRQQALSYAVAGDARASKNAASQAVETVLTEGPQDADCEYASPAYVLMETGASAFHTRRLNLAAERLSQAAAQWPAGFARDQGLCLARLAVVEVSRGNVELAVAVGRDAIARC